MKKRFISIFCLGVTVFSILTGCNNSDEETFSGNFSAKDAIKIEDLDWNIADSIIDGEKYVSFGYTNNSKYTILEFEIKFTQKDDVTDKQLSVFDSIVENSLWEKTDIFITGDNRKCADPGETVSDSPCRINNTYTTVESMEQYEIMEPDTATILFIGPGNKGYVMYYDFKTQTYGESSQGGQDLQQWSDSNICKLLPRPNVPATTVSSDKEDYFFFYAYGVSKEMFDAYVEEVKANGFTEVGFESNTSYRATNSDGFEIQITYVSYEETMTGNIEKKD